MKKRSKASVGVCCAVRFNVMIRTGQQCNWQTNWCARNRSISRAQLKPHRAVVVGRLVDVTEVVVGRAAEGMGEQRGGRRFSRFG